MKTWLASPSFRLKNTTFSKQHLLIFIAVFAALGGVLIYRSLATSDTFTANLFVVPANYTGSPAASANCARKSTPVTFANAAGSICAYGSNFTSWDKACDASTAGDVVGVTPGTYPTVTGGGYLMGNGTTDCAKGLAGDVDPNAEEKGISTGSTANWVKFVPTSDQNCPNVNFNLGRVAFAFRNFHMIVKGKCFNFNTTIYVHDGNTNTIGRPQNLQFMGDSKTEPMKVYGVELRGPRNVMFKNINYGPNVQCTANDANATPAYFRCDPSGPPFEAPLAVRGTNSPGCNPNNTPLCAGFFEGPGGANEFVEPYIHSGAYGAYTNIRFEDFIVHDGQAKGTGSGVHPGCFMYDGNAGISGLPPHNMVFDHVACERQVIGVQNSDSGVTIQNSFFSCPTVDLPQTSPQGLWDVCAAPQPEIGVGCRNDLSPGCVVSNVLIRYNVFFGGVNTALLIQQPSSTYGTYSNFRVIGNIFMAPIAGCGIAGLTIANNAFGPGVPTCGSNATTLSGDPFVDSDQSTGPDRLWRSTSQLNPRLNGNVTVPILNPSVLGLDYQLNHDGDRNPRSNTSTPVGAFDTTATGTTPTVSLSASPTSVSSGSASTLTWSSTNATSCTASGAWSGTKTTSGSQSTGNLTSTSTFTLTCTGTGGSANASATVTVGAVTQDPATDDFERAALGSNWQLNLGSGGIINNSDLGILSGSISINSWVGSTFSNNQFSQAQISTNASSEMQKQIFVRRRSSDSARYAFHYNIESSPLRWEIKYDGVPTAQTKLLATNSTAPAPVPGDTLRLEAEGDTLRGYHNGNLVLSATDSSAEKITAGPPGLTFRLIGNANVAQPEPVFESWSGGSISAPTQKPGDLNNDGSVNILDLSILLSNYGKPATPSQGDINGDGNCTILDLSILLSKYGT